MDAIPNLGEIVEASDGVMVARGDLGSQVPLEDVPVLQKQIARLCRQAGKPCMVASHFLQSMLEFPTPTRAEVADIADALRQKSDGMYPAPRAPPVPPTPRTLCTHPPAGLPLTHPPTH